MGARPIDRFEYDDPQETDEREREPAHSLAVLAAFVLGVMVLGAVMGATNAPDEWYRALEKPFFNPPDWVFAPVWTVLYAMVGYAGYLVWREAGQRSFLFGLWLAQMVLNLAWTPIFFTGRSLPLASMEILLFLVAVVAFMVRARTEVPRAFLLFIPYAAWVSFATVLTWTIWALN